MVTPFHSYVFTNKQVGKLLLCADNNPKNWVLSMSRRRQKVDSKRLFIVVIKL